MMWFVQARKACMCESCMYSKVKKIKKQGKHGSDELDTKKKKNQKQKQKPHITIYIGIGVLSHLNRNTYSEKI